MPDVATDLAPATNHVFVDYENVHRIDHAIIGKKAVSFTLLVGPRQSIDGAVVEELFKHAASVQLVRLASAGKNALDFILAYYVGRAVVTDPTGYYHIVSRDTGFDPLIQHLQSKHIHIRRHDGFDTLTFAAPSKAKVPTAPASASATAPVPAVPAKPKTQPKTKAQPTILEERVNRVLDRLRKSPKGRPTNQTRLVRYVFTQLGQKITEAEASEVVEALGQAGHLNIGEKERVTYFLE